MEDALNPMPAKASERGLDPALEAKDKRISGLLHQGLVEIRHGTNPSVGGSGKSCLVSLRY